MNINTQDFKAQDMRSLPVILLLDSSGSMEINDNIGTLNNAVKDMLQSFADFEHDRVEIKVAIIGFGGEDAVLLQDLKNTKEIKHKPLKAAGRTPLKAALLEATKLVEDRTKIGSRSYRPMIVLVSDGSPTDNYVETLHSFVTSGRTAKCDRFAMGIGENADKNMLATFLNDQDKRVFSSDTARDITMFFKFITMTATAKSVSSDPSAKVPKSVMAESAPQWSQDLDLDDFLI